MIQIQYALDREKNLIDINSSPRRDLEYFCIDCNKLLIPKMGKIKEYHFAHKFQKDSETCNYCNESYLHFQAKNYIFKKLKERKLERKLIATFKYKKDNSFYKLKNLFIFCEILEFLNSEKFESCHFCKNTEIKFSKKQIQKFHDLFIEEFNFFIKYHKTVSSSISSSKLIYIFTNMFWQRSLKLNNRYWKKLLLKVAIEENKELKKLFLDLRSKNKNLRDFFDEMLNRESLKGGCNLIKRYQKIIYYHFLFREFGANWVHYQYKKHFSYGYYYSYFMEEKLKSTGYSIFSKTKNLIIDNSEVFFKDILKNYKESVKVEKVNRYESCYKNRFLTIKTDFIKNIYLDNKIVKGFKADILIETTFKNIPYIFVEIKNTHKSTEEKINSKVPIVEIEIDSEEKLKMLENSNLKSIKIEKYNFPKKFETMEFSFTS